MKKEIISIAAAAVTACCACLSPVYAVDETEVLTQETVFEMCTRIGISTVTGDNPRYPLERYTGNAHFRLVQNDENGKEIREIGEWYSYELEQNSLKVTFEYTINSEDEIVYFSWIVDGLDEGYYPSSGWSDEGTIINSFKIDAEKRDFYEVDRKNGYDYGNECFVRLIPNNAVIDESTTDGTYLIYGDANLDDNVTISDSVAILQYIANNEKYPLDDNARANADVYNPGDGITGNDANSIMKLDAGVIDSLPETLS